VAGRYFNGGPMGIREGCNTLTVSGVTAHPPLPGISGQEKRLVHYFNLYPNFLFSLAPDYVMAHYLWPPGGRSPSTSKPSGSARRRRWSTRISTPATPSTSGIGPTARTGRCAGGFSPDIR